MNSHKWRRRARTLLSVMFLAGLAAPARLWAQSDAERYTIMKPDPGSARGTMWEPWLAPKYRSPRGTRRHTVTPRPAPDEPRRIPDMPPPIVSPRTGQALPNIVPPAPGSGLGGRETFQDRSTRCTHQAGMYGQQAGSNYIGTCLNQ